MREISINYSNTENLINNLLNILNNLDIEKSNVKKALNELYDLENYYSNKGGIISELEYRERRIDNDIRNTEELIHNLKSFSTSVQETDERLAQKFKQDIKSYAKQNNIELVSELDNFLKKAQMALDGIGLIPGIGEIADGINGVISLTQGNWKDAIISFMAIIPFAGDSLKALKYTDEASELLKLGDKVVDLKKGGEKLSKVADKLDDLKIKEIDFNISTKKPGSKNFTRGFDVEPKYSSLNERIKITPSKNSKNGTWVGERGESLFVSDDIRVKKFLDEKGVKGIEYKNGMPDFSTFTKAEFKIKDMTNSRSSNFYQADEMLAKEWTKIKGKKYTIDDVANWRRENGYTWHELNDLETMQLVPSKINAPVFKHLGGVGEYNIKLKKGK